VAPTLPADLVLHLDASTAKPFVGDVVRDLSEKKLQFLGPRARPVIARPVDNFMAFDMNASAGEISVSKGKRWTVAQDYTHCAWVKWRISNAGYRTLFRGSSDHSVIVMSEWYGPTPELGMYSNRAGGFQGSGYNIVPGAWNLVCVVGSGRTRDSPEGESTFYVGTLTQEPDRVGKKVSRVVSGTQVQLIGYSGQSPGFLAKFFAWNRALSRDEIVDVWEASMLEAAPTAAPTPAASPRSQV